MQHRVGMIGDCSHSAVPAEISLQFSCALLHAIGVSLKGFLSLSQKEDVRVLLLLLGLQLSCDTSASFQ